MENEFLNKINKLVSEYEKHKNEKAFKQARELLAKEIKKRQLPTDQSR